jgi:hypothetical protein
MFHPGFRQLTERSAVHRLGFGRIGQPAEADFTFEFFQRMAEFLQLLVAACRG